MTRANILKRLAVVVGGSATQTASAACFPAAVDAAASKHVTTALHRHSRRWIATSPWVGSEIKEALAAAIPAQQVRSRDTAVP